MALYRLPFLEDPLWSLGTGNWDDPKGGHGLGQPYAYDFGHPEGGVLVAARAGTVVALANDVSINTWDLPDSDPNKAKFGAGNYVLIRHADNTLAAYDHMKKGSVKVQKFQWVPQGFHIGLSGNTGNSSDPHCHFEVHSYWNSDNDMGSSILIHFEDNQHQAWRPRDGDALHSNNNVPRQDVWLWCRKCQGLFYGGNPDSKCPAAGEHDGTDSGSYSLVIDSPQSTGQAGWRWCHKCQGLFFSKESPSKCPAGGGHSADTSGDYKLAQNVQDSSGQAGWRWCHNCQGLFFKGAATSVCPAGNGHSESGSGDYWLSLSAPADLQFHWRWCPKCQGLFHGGQGGGVCPADHAAHTTAPTPTNYILAKDYNDAPGQHGWRWCSKCQGLWMGANDGSHCPAGGAHKKEASGNYALVDSAKGPGQAEWRWCSKCQGLWMGANSGSHCPAGGPHSKSGSSDYRLQSDPK